MKHFSLSVRTFVNIAKTALFILMMFGTMQVRAQITVTASAGVVGPTVYGTLNAAINAVNVGIHQGNILLSVTANTTETVQSTLVQSGSGAANYFSLTIKPAPATNPVISGNIATGILFILGSNVTIDGSNTVGGTTRDLTISNTNAANSYVLRIGSPSTSLGAVTDAITNCVIQGANPFGGIGMLVGSGVTVANYAESPNTKTVIQNNSISGEEQGIAYYGCIASPDFEAAITGNVISCTVYGIIFAFTQFGTVSANTITGSAINPNFAMAGIDLNGTMISANIYNNTISGFHNTSAGAAAAAYGIDLFSFNGPVNVYNNFIYDIISNGNAAAASNGEGIYIGQGSGYYIYHNTVNMGTNQVAAAGAPSAIMIAAGVTSPGAIYLENNILANNQSGGSTQRYSIYSAAPASVFAAIDNNDYYTASGPNLGFLGGNQPTLAAVRTAFGSNTHSLNVSPPFVSATNLHINIVACSGTPLESGGAVVGIPTDIDGQLRPGPVPSSCGGGTAPDIGADEFDGGINDMTPPAITYTPQQNICTPADVFLAPVTITDATGVPTSGPLMPRVYFSKNAGPWFSAAGTLSSGTTISGNWSFTIPMAAMGGLAVGDVVSYYVIAQDNFGNIISNPATGLVATDVNTVTTPPTTPNTYTIGVSLSGVYHVGVAGTYTTLTAAVNAYNTACLLGPVTFLLDDPTYPSETFPITVKYNSYANAVNTLTIMPSGNTTISGALAGGNGLFFLNGARYVTVDGSNSGTTSQNLTWQNTSGVANAYVMRLGNASTTITATNNTIKNCIIIAGGTTVQNFGVISGSGTAFLGVAECPLINNTIQNNNISNAEYGMYLNGFSSTADSNWTINNNTVTAGRWALALYYMQNSNIATNTITVTSNLTTIAAILLNGAFYNTNVYGNKINGVVNTSANGAYGLYLVVNNGSSGVNIFNNFISNCAGTGAAALANNGYGIYAAFGTGYNIVENSVNMGTNQTAGTGTSAAMCINGVTLPGAMNIIDNIFSNNQTAAVPVASRYSIYSANPNTIFGTINYNDYYTQTGNNLGFLGGNRANLAAIQAGFGGNLNSINLMPTFVSPTDLHLQILASNAGLNAGLFIVGVTTDIDGDTRLSPTIGADELILCPLPIAGTPITCVGTTTNLTDPTTGGVWSSVAGTGTANVGTSGIVTGVTAGTVTISYTIGTCGVAMVVTVNPGPIPGVITGSLTVCPTLTTALSDATGDPGGVWSSVSPGIVTVGTGGVVTGVVAGTSTISYTVTNTCGSLAATAVVTVNPTPNAGAITGTLTVCTTATTLLSDATGTAGGVWSSVSPGIATVGAAGLVTGVTPGTSTISYTVTNSCGVAAATAVVTVNLTPVAGVITGSLTVCPTTTTALTDATGTAGGVWSSVSPGIATVSATGLVTGVAAGTSTISYTVSGSCGTVAATAVVTVNPNPVAGSVTGTFTVCPTATTLLTDAVGGGVWSSVSPGIATISGTGLVTGVAAGTSTISYAVTNSCGTAAATAVVTVNPLPNAGAITGGLVVCPTATISLGDPTGDIGGVWSSVSPGIATISGVGLVTGVASGTTTISYTVTNSCGVAAATAVVTVSLTPNAGSITGGLVVCPTTTTNLTDGAGAGVWSSVSPGIATVSGTGLVTGVAAGTSTISYTVTNSCGVAAATAVVTVNPAPVAGTITGGLVVCPTTTTNVTDAAGGGVWSSVSPGIAGVGATGLVTGIAAGTSTISYTVTNSCGTVAATVIVTVNPAPVAGTITGGLVVCPTTTTNLTDAAGGGIWSSVSPGIATVGGTGLVTGVAAGTSTISYTVTNSCGTVAATAVVTVNPAPVAGAITGGLIVCPTTTTNLTDAAGGGIWSSVSPGIATVGGTGLVTGVAAGTSTISYTVTNSCGTVAATAMVTVNPSPNAGSITGGLTICPTLTTALTDLTGSAGGVWSSVTPGVASVSGTGLVTGIANGTSTISYTVTNSCGVAAATAIVTVNASPNAGLITGGLVVCPATTTQLTDVTGGGIWSSVSPLVASVSGTGLVTGLTNGTSTISYTVTNTCGTAAATVVVTVNPSPNAGTINGVLTMCPTTSTVLTDATGGGTWSSVSPGVATINIFGVVTGVTAGTSIISYAVTNSCGTAAATAIVTVNPSPNAGSITGIMVVCPSGTTPLSDAVGGGIWSSVSPAIASIGPTGLVTGVASGTSIISYAVTNSCGTAAATAVVTVNATPNAGSITGVLTVCPAATTPLSDASGGGVWSSVSPAFATINASGVVTGVVPGTSTISYTVTNSCGVAAATAVVTVNSLSTAGFITGTFTVCPGAAVALTDATGGGVWSSASPGTATVDALGNVSGVSAGTSAISYAVTNSCNTAYTSAIVTVNPSPNPGVITGTAVVCASSTTLLHDAVAGGTWNSLNTSVATITSSGLVTGVSLGTSTIFYGVTNICGTAYASVVVSVNPAPNAGTIEGSLVVCPTTSATLSDPASGGGGTWTSVTPAIATIGSATGIVTGVATGTAVITYSTTNSCGTATTSTTVTVHPFPTPLTGDSIVCQENNIVLRDSVSGGLWSGSNPLIATVGPAVGFPTEGVVSGLSVGTVTVSYVVAPGCFVSKVVTVNPLGAIAAASQLCVGSSEAAVDLPVGGTWSSSNPSVAGIDIASGNITGIASGATIISYILAPGCVVSTAVTVNPLPTNYDVTGGGSYCLGSAGVDIGLNGSDTGASYRLIYSGPATVLAGTGDALDFGIYSVSGTYVVQATDVATGCTTSMTGSATVSISTPAVPALSINAYPGTVVCLGSAASFTAIPTAGGSTPTYNWYVNGIGVGTGNTYGYVPVSGDVVSVKLTSNATCVLPDTAMGAVTITTTTGLMPSVSISASPGDSVCPGTPVTIIPSSSWGGTPTYQWVKNGVDVGSGATYNFLPTDGDNIFCWMYSSLSCALLDSVASNNIVMAVPQLYIPAVSITAIPGNRIAHGETVTLVATVSFGGNSLAYQWNINGSPVAGAVSDTFISNTFANHDSVTCNVTGYSLCGLEMRTASILIIDTFATGVQNLAEGTPDLRLVPNPNNGTFILKGTARATDDELAVIITDMLGQVVYEGKIAVTNGKINEQIRLNQTLANGMYLLDARSGSESSVFHFVIEK